MTSIYDTVYAGNEEQWIALCSLPAALKGSWNPATKSGWVRFGTPAAAQAARGETVK